MQPAKEIAGKKAFLTKSCSWKRTVFESSTIHSFPELDHGRELFKFLLMEGAPMSDGAGSDGFPLIHERERALLLLSLRPRSGF